MNKKITLPELVEMLAETTGMQKKICESFIKDLIDTLLTSLLNDESIKIAGLGVFKCVVVDARKSIDVNTGEEIEIPSYRKVTLTVEKSMAQAVNSAFAEFQTVEIDDSITDEMLSDKTDEQTPEPPTQESEQDATETEEIIVTAPTAPDNIETPTEHLEEMAAVPSEDAATEQPEEPEVPTEQVHDTDNSPEIYETDDDSDCNHSKRNLIWGIVCGFILGVAAAYVALVYFDGNIPGIKYKLASTEVIATDIDTAADTITANISSESNIDTQQLQTDNTVVTDTVGRTRFLTTMARKYYGNFNFWVYIYMENKNIINNPNNIAPGTVVVIPDAEKYGIDKNSSASIAQAQRIAAEIKEQFD